MQTKDGCFTEICEHGSLFGNMSIRKLYFREDMFWELVFGKLLSFDQTLYYFSFKSSFFHTRLPVFCFLQYS